MGSGISAQKKSSSWNLRPSLVHSEIDKHSNSMPIESTIDKPDNNVSSSHGYGSRVSPFNSVSRLSNNGSKEEAFFDSQAWLESDCEDEFYSVGDFTSSRGSTPLYRSIPGTPLSRNLSPQVNRAQFEETIRSSPGNTPHHRRVDSEVVEKISSPLIERKKRKKLAELFRESIRERDEEESANVDSYISDAKLEGKIGEKKEKNVQRCLPRLRLGGFMKKTMAPASTPTPLIDVGA